MRWGGLNCLQILGPLPSCSHLCCGDAGRTRGHVHTKLRRQTVHPSPNWPWSCLACKIGHDWVPSRWYSQSPALSACWHSSPAVMTWSLSGDFKNNTFSFSPFRQILPLFIGVILRLLLILLFQHFVVVFFFVFIWRVFGSSTDDIFSLSCHSLMNLNHSRIHLFTEQPHRNTLQLCLL